MPSAWEEYKKSLGDTRPWDLLNPGVERCTDEEQKSRNKQKKDILARLS